MNKHTNRLKEIRIENGLTIKALSKLLNISAKTLSKYEKSHCSMPLTPLLKLCIVFNIRLDYVLGINDIKHPIKPYNKK